MAGEQTTKLRLGESLRHKLIALDPVAAALWFHTFLIATIEELLGFDMKRRKAKHRGVLGTVLALAVSGSTTGGRFRDVCQISATLYPLKRAHILISSMWSKHTAEAVYTRISRS